MSNAIRSPICSVMGHVDHGKSSLLDMIRGTNIVKGEAGAITQAIGASIIPLETIKKTCGALLDALKMNLTIPGLLFIDTPGHAAFTNLRKRGGNLADIAILVIDINEGLKPQTIESIEILKQYKTPFIIALNKLDLLSGWTKQEGPVLGQVKKQQEQIQYAFEGKLYEVVGALQEHGVDSDRFDRVEDFTKKVAIVPTSAKTGIGLSELLMVMTGLAQKFLEQDLKFNPEGPAKGTILEVKEDKGLGKTMDAIIYDGTLKTGDTIVIAGLNGPITTRVKALFEPNPLAEMRDKKSQFTGVKQVRAATGVKISAPETEHVVSGMPMRGATPETLEKIKEEIQAEVEEVLMETNDEGVIIKADSLGSLEALLKLLQEQNIPIRKASIGNITKKDIAEAEANLEKDPLTAAILAFNIKTDENPAHVKIITSEVVYKIIEDYEKWKEQKQKEMQAGDISKLIKPCKVQILKGYVFRQSNPAICGMEVIAGTLKSGMPLMTKDGQEITEVKGIQKDKESVDALEKGEQAAVSMPGITIGRQVHEEDELFSSIPEEDFKKLKGLKELLSPEEKETIRQISEIKRRENVVWGV